MHKHTLPTILPVICTLMACGDKSSNGDNIDTPQESHVDASTLENTECQDVNGTPVPGAAVYYAGTMVLNGSTVSGVENVFFIANDAWIGTGNDDCEVTLAVSGSVTDPLGCAICDTAISIAATMVESQSTCPAGLQQDYQSYTVTYDIQRLDDGTANWFFHESGNQFASGSHTDTSLEYLSDAQCQWY